MSVTMFFSTTPGGGGLADIDHGSAAAGGFVPSASGRTLYIRHDGDNNITGCKLFINPWSGYAYANAGADFLEMLAWGDGLAAGGPAEASEFGGVQINMDTITGFAAPWPTFASPGANGDLTVAMRTGVGDNLSNGIDLHANAQAGGGATGVIEAGSTATSIKIRFQIPTDVATTGARQVDLRMRFTFTS